jgi:uncharacterized delta-60 repeat protein
MFTFTPARIVSIVIRLSAAIAAPAFAFVILLNMLSMFSTPASAATDAEGDLDATFGNGGVVTTTLPGQIIRVFSVGKDKVLAFGKSRVTDSPTYLTQYTWLRFRGDGSLDPRFGANGIVTLTVMSDFATSVILPDGGFLFSDWQLRRFTSAGKPDLSFGVNGVVTQVVSGKGKTASSLRPIGVQSDGKIIAFASGYSLGVPPFYISDIDVLVRLGPDGQVDFSFGDQGFAVPVNAGPKITNLGDVVILNSDRLVTNYYTSHQYHSEAFIDAYSPDGNVISHTRVVRENCNDLYVRLLQLPDDQFLVNTGSDSSYPCTRDSYLSRHNADLTLDPTFGISGILSPANFSLVKAQSDGKLLGIGGGIAYGYGSAYSMTVSRYLPDASPDLTFGSGGLTGAVITTTRPTIFGTEVLTSSGASSVAIALDGKIVVGGSYQVRPASGDLISYMALARFVGPPVVLRDFYLPFAPR